MSAIPQPASSLPSVPKSRMQSDDRRRQLLRVAIESFARNGFSGTKTKDIAAAAGVSEAILFRHFASKEDLYHAILDIHESKEGIAQRIKELQAFAERRDDVGLFRHLGRQIVRSFRDDAAFHRLLMYALLEGHLLANLFHERFVLPTGHFLRSYVALRQKEGAFRPVDPDIAVMFVCRTFVQLGMDRYVFGAKKRLRGDEVMLDELVGLVMGGLKSPDKKRRKGTKA